LDSIIADKKLKYIVLYLCPGDYHRYHSPVDGIFTDRIYIPGYLEPVMPKYIAKHKNVFKTNERVSLIGKRGESLFAIVFVCAINVGSVCLHFDDEYTTNIKRVK